MGKERLIGLDILRGFAVTTVFIAHILLFIPKDFFIQIHSITWRVTYLANYSVDCFFALSGFLIGGSLLDYEKYDFKSLYNYSIDRITKIFPCYHIIFIMTAFAYIIFGYTYPLSYLLFIQAYTNDLYFIGVAWTLSIEIFSYILMPFFLYIFKFKIKLLNNSYINIMLFIFIFILIESVFRYLSALNTPNIVLDDAIRKMPHLRMDALFYGLCISCARKAFPVIYNKMASPIVFIVIILAISIFLEWQYSDSFIQNTEFEKNKDIQSLIGFSLSGVLSAAILPFLSKTTLNTEKLCKIKSFFLYMSKISYPFYLVHLQVLSLFISIYYKIDISNIYLKHVLFIFIVIISIKVTFLTSSLLHKYIENPSIRLRKKIKIS